MWHQDTKLEDLAWMRKDTILEVLDIQLTELGPDYITGTMPVDHRTVQPYRILHGGASVVLAETLGSIAANLTVDLDQFYTVGLDINANHIRQAREGRVTGTARPVHVGRSTQVWSIEITNEQGKLVCICRITMMVVPKSK